MITTYSPPIVKSSKRPRRNRKKRYPKRGRRVIHRNQIGLTGPLNTKIGTKLIYETGQIGATTTVAPGTFTISLNDMYDPQYGLGGHQPRGFDELKAIYGIYRVLAVKVMIYGQALSTGSHIIGYSINSSATPPGDVNSYMESRNKKFKFATLDRPTVIKCYTSIAKAQGVDSERVRVDDEFCAGVGTSPQSIPFFHIFYQNNDETTSSGFNVRATVTFYTEFSHPNVLPQS